MPCTCVEFPLGSWLRVVPENASLSPTERFWGMRALLGRLQLLHSLGEATPLPLTRPGPTLPRDAPLETGEHIRS